LDSTLLFSSESYAWGLHGICQLHRIPFAPQVVLQQIPPPYTLLSFQHAAQAIGLKSASHHAVVSQLPHLPLPCLAVLKAKTPAITEDGKSVTRPEGETTEPAWCRPAIVLRCDAERVLYVVEGEQTPLNVTLSAFEQDYAGTVLLFSPGTESRARYGESLKTAQPFGFRWFVPELLKHGTIWRDVLLASLAIQLMALATPVFTQVVIDKVIVHHTVNTLVVIGIGLFMFMVFTAGMSWVRQYLVLHTGNRIDAVLGAQVFEHLFKLSLRYFEHRPTGTLVARVQGVETIRAFVSGAAVTLMLDVPFLFIFLSVMFYYSWILTLITLAVLMLITALSLLITPLLRERINQQFLLGARNQAFLTEYVAGMETVKSLQMEPRLSARFGDYLASYLQAGFKTRQLSNTYNVAANTLEQFLVLAILCVGAWLVMTTQSVTIGMLVAFQMFASRLSGPMLRMVGLWLEFQQASIAVQRLGDVMNAPAEPYSMLPAREGGGRGRIEIRNLSFRYAENLPYLYHGFSLAVEPGRCMAVMGPSGSGKSTLAKLLQGFYQPTDGAIHLDDHDIGHLSANELRQYFGVVPQDTVLFSGTVYENLVLANPHASFERVVQACKLAEIHGVIEQLPEGYQTPIGEHGVGLSGGQKQRIAIARALLKRPKILIFDEATSSLDARTAEQFARTVNRLKGKVTMLFIAHQLPKGLHVDSVINLGPQESHMSMVGNEQKDA
jgi:ATP-binding cassette, subfamily B, bacterial HlyB/CyaB